MDDEAQASACRLLRKILRQCCRTLPLIVLPLVGAGIAAFTLLSCSDESTQGYVLLEETFTLGTYPPESFAIQLIRDGTVEITVDWDDARNNIDAGLYASPCSYFDMKGGSCLEIASAESLRKPERIKIESLAAGEYTVWVFNSGLNEDTVNLRIYFTPD